MSKLEIWTEELSGNWVWNANSYVGGTPEFICNTAKCADFDEKIVYYDGMPMIIDDVYFLPRSSFIGDDVVLCCNSISPKMGRHNIYWTNWLHQTQEIVMDFDERIVISEYQKKKFGDKSRVVPHSCWPDEFDGSNKIEKQCLYSSAPDRGLNFLLGIWDEVKDRTGATLIHTYNNLYSNSMMVDLYNKSQFWLHPCQGVELFCIAAVKAQVAKCIPVVVPNMALLETVKYGVKTTLDNYKEDLIKAIENPPKVEDVDFGDWKSVTKELFKNVNQEVLL